MTGFLIIALFAATACLAMAVLSDSALRGLSAYRDIKLRTRFGVQNASFMYKAAQFERSPSEPWMRGVSRGHAPRVTARRTEMKLRAAA